jgi:hypothetical protein
VGTKETGEFSVVGEETKRAFEIDSNAACLHEPQRSGLQAGSLASAAEKKVGVPERCGAMGIIGVVGEQASEAPMGAGAQNMVTRRGDLAKCHRSCGMVGAARFVEIDGGLFSGVLRERFPEVSEKWVVSDGGGHALNVLEAEGGVRKLQKAEIALHSEGQDS